ncbi:MAG: carboxypeptidase regulatory-like domain-containing protein [Planctomycetota bacterium]
MAIGFLADRICGCNVVSPSRSKKPTPLCFLAIPTRTTSLGGCMTSQELDHDSQAPRDRDPANRDVPGPMRACSRPAGVIVLVLTSLLCSGSLAQDTAGTTADHFPWPYRLRLGTDHPLEIEGRVLGPDGNPVGGAALAVIADLESLLVPVIPPQVLCAATCGEDGSFHLSLSVPLPCQCRSLKLVARQGNHGSGTCELDLLRRRQVVTVPLPPGRKICGRVVDPAGHPVANAEVHLVGIPDAASGIYFSGRVRAPAAWPASARTDGQGSFQLSNVPRGANRLPFEIDDERYAPGLFSVDIPEDENRGVLLTLSSSRIVEGTVVRADTGKPLPNAWLLVVLGGGSGTGDLQHEGIPATTDENGRFHARCRPGEYLTTYVYPPFGEPYPSWVEASAPWPRDAPRKELLVSIPRGILVRGRVVDAESGDGIADAGVEYMIRREMPNRTIDREACHRLYWAAEYRRSLTRTDGSFEIAVMPGAGFLLVRAPNPEFISQPVTWGELQLDKKGGHFLAVDGLLRIDPTPEDRSLSVTIPLHRGITITGQLVGPHAENVRAAVALYSYYQLGFSPPFRPVAVIDGRFELPGCDPSKPTRVFFLDAHDGWGTSTELHADDSTAVRRIGLGVCGSATAWFVDEQNRPWVSMRPPFMLPQIVTEVCPPFADDLGASPPHLGWDERYLDFESYRDLHTGDEGQVTFPGLIPGAPYKLLVCTPPDFHFHDVRDFMVGPGEDLDLSEITVRRPGSR